MCVLFLGQFALGRLEPVIDLKQEVYRGDDEQFDVPEGWTLKVGKDWISFHRRNCKRRTLMRGYENQSRYFKWNISDWASYEKKDFPARVLGFIFAHIQDPLYDKEGVFSGKKYIAPYFVMGVLSKSFEDFVGPLFPLHICHWLAQYGKGVLNGQFYVDLQKSKIVDCLKNVYQKKDEACVSDAKEKAYDILNKLPAYISTSVLKGIKREAIKGKSYRYKLHLQIKKEYLVSFVNAFVLLLNEDPRLKAICKFKFLKKIPRGWENPKYSGLVSGIIGVYLPLVPGNNEYRHTLIKPFVQAIWDYFKKVATKIYNGVRPRGNIQIEDFIYIGAGEGMNKLELFKREQEEIFPWINTTYTPDYTSFIGYEIVPSLLLDKEVE